MTRAEEIAELQRQYAAAIADRKLKRAGLIYARLCSLMLRQLRAENRKRAA